MKKFLVVISGQVTKTIKVDAANEDEAVELAQSLFTMNPEEGELGEYDQWFEDCEEITD